MKRKQIINLIFLVVLIIASVWIILENRNTTLKLPLDAFAEKDTAAITKVFIADMKGQSVTLSRKNGSWLINEEFPANQTNIENMLEVLVKMEIKSPTPESMMDNVIKSMANEAVKVEIYKQKKKPVKVLYVGGPTQDHTGTFMAIEKYKKIPYIMHIPGWIGYMSEGYFFTDAAEWRSKAVFTYDPLSIAKIKVDYHNYPDSSYEIRVGNDYNFVLKTGREGRVINSFNKISVKSYLQGFTSFYLMEVDNYIDAKKRDSILSAGPVVTISVTDKEGKTKMLNVFYKPTDLQTKAELFEGVDKEHFYGILSEREEELIILQALNLNKLMWKIEDFVK